MSNYRDAIQDILDLIDDNYPKPSQEIKELRDTIVELINLYDYDQANA